MSKVKIEGNASGTGTLTISAPNTNTDRSLTLPDGAGEILTDAGLKTINGSSIVGSGDLEVGGGKVLQVVQSTYSTESSVSGTTFASLPLSVNITPSAITSKVYVIAMLGADSQNPSAAWWTLYRNNYTNLGNGNNGLIMTTVNWEKENIVLSYLDSPSETSSVNYQVYARTEGAYNAYICASNSLNTIIAMEIDGS